MENVKEINLQVEEISCCKTAVIPLHSELVVFDPKIANPLLSIKARVAELADAQDLGSCG